MISPILNSGILSVIRAKSLNVASKRLIDFTNFTYNSVPINFDTELDRTRGLEAMVLVERNEKTLSTIYLLTRDTNLHLLLTDI